MKFLKKLLGKSQEMPLASFSDLKVDMHSHLIPGVDDGAKNMENSLSLIRALKDLGYSRLITTPHIMSDVYPNKKDDLLQRTEELRAQLVKEGIDMDILVAAEYFLDDHFMELIQKKELLTFGRDKNYILFEMSFIEKSPMLQEAIFELQSQELKPILAHPERYTYLHGSFEEYESLVDQGVLLQLNINSVTGHYSPQVTKVSEKLINKELIHFLGTDCHHEGHLELMNRALSHPALNDLIRSGRLKNYDLLG